MKKYFTTILLFALCSGCSSFAYTNKKLDPQQTQFTNNRAQLTIERDRGEDGTLFLLALSGGGSRASYFSAEVMLALQEIAINENGKNLLQSIDAISSVSGGSLPAAYYVISKDPNDTTENVKSGRVWDRSTVEDLMSRNYIARWIGNWFWPNNIARYWATAYDRSDIMAQTFADNMFDTSVAGIDLEFKDINQERPYIIINSTSGTSSDFGRLFTFTHDDFSQLDSDISQYEISRAVMASASFPAVFNYMTLNNYKKGESNEYLHVFDGGNFDNLGLESVRNVINKPENAKYNKIVVFLVDAFTKPQGVPYYEYDARSGFNYAVDFNFLDSTDSLLKKVRKDTLDATENLITTLAASGKQAMFYHLSFSEVQHFTGATAKVRAYSAAEQNYVDTVKPLFDVLNEIPTNFNISEENQRAISDAVKLVVNTDNECIQKILAIIKNEDTGTPPAVCSWPTVDMNLAKSQ